MKIVSVTVAGVFRRIILQFICVWVLFPNAGSWDVFLFFGSFSLIITFVHVWSVWFCSGFVVVVVCFCVVVVGGGGGCRGGGWTKIEHYLECKERRACI